MATIKARTKEAQDRIKFVRNGLNKLAHEKEKLLRDMVDRHSVKTAQVNVTLQPLLSIVTSLRTSAVAGNRASSTVADRRHGGDQKA